VRIDSAELASNVLPALTAGAPGRIDLTWYGSRSSDFTNGHAKWAEMFAQSLDALSRHPAFAQSRISGSLPVHVGSVNSAGNPGSSLYDWDLRDFQSVVVDRCGMAHVAWTNDNHRGSTAVATQTTGHSLLSSRLRC
jgi:hypothetical protein